MRPKPQKTTDLFLFTEEIFNGNLYFLSIAAAIGDMMF